MNADTLEYLAEMLSKIDAATSCFQLVGTVDVNDGDEFLGRLVLAGEVESTFEAA